MIMNGKNDIWIVKYKQAGKDDVWIAKKLGLTLEQVAHDWNRVVTQAETSLASGGAALAGQFHVLCQQYQLVGESLKILGKAISHQVTIEDILPLVSGSPQETAERILANYIVLMPFVAVDPQKSLEESIKSQLQGN